MPVCLSTLNANNMKPTTTKQKRSWKQSTKQVKKMVLHCSQEQNEIDSIAENCWYYRKKRRKNKSQNQSESTTNDTGCDPFHHNAQNKNALHDIYSDFYIHFVRILVYLLHSSMDPNVSNFLNFLARFSLDLANKIAFTHCCRKNAAMLNSHRKQTYIPARLFKFHVFRVARSRNRLVHANTYHRKKQSLLNSSYFESNSFADILQFALLLYFCISAIAPLKCNGCHDFKRSQAANRLFQTYNQITSGDVWQ